MPLPDYQPSWFGPTLLDGQAEALEDQQEYRRLWTGFVTARAVVGLTLFVVQGALYLFAQSGQPLLVLLTAAFFAVTLATRIAAQPRKLGPTLDRYWFALTGLDVLVFTTLQWLHGSVINYTPLYALPILLTAVLGSLRLAMGAAAGVTLLLLLYSGWQSMHGASQSAPFVQAALTGAGCFMIAFLAHQLAARLAQEQQRTRRSQQATRMQQQVNQLVIESITDGILVVDMRGLVHAANPAARQMLQADGRPLRARTFNLTNESAWQPLAELSFHVFSGGDNFHHADIDIQHKGQGSRSLRVRGRITQDRGGEGEILCVIFMQDLREMEARMRTEKLASMGRMSAAVAHEIRNPLAAIAQANALLEEDLPEPRLKRLTKMISQNATRLDKIVNDVLNISRVGVRSLSFEPQALDLNSTVSRVCRDWAQQTGAASALALRLAPLSPVVNFDPDHLRRVLVNLLDNAYRYASRQAESILIITQEDNHASARLAVWSDGAPMEQSVEQHLFEPFFSSESRSSGLGLYICRELCDGHGATIAYRRSRQTARHALMEGNEFFITLRQTNRDERPVFEPSQPTLL